MKTLCLLVVSATLSWTTFAGSSSRSGSTQTPVWPAFKVKWSVNLGDPGTRVATPVTFENYHIVKYVTRKEGYKLHVRAFDRNGKDLWHFIDELNPKFPFAINSRDYEGSPSIAGQCVYFTGTRKLYCLTLDEGKKLWDFEFDIREDDEITTVCPLIYGDGNRMLVATLAAGKVYINEGTKGILIKTVKNISGNIPPAKLSDDSILCPVHLTNTGTQLAQLPKEALGQKGGFATGNNLAVGYYLNAKYMAWRFNSLYNRWEKAWEYVDKTAQQSPFQSYRHPTIVGDRVILSLPKKIVCVDLDGKELWSHESPLCRWNQMVPVAGNVVLITTFSHGQDMQALDIRDGLPYDAQKLPVFLQTPPTPTDDGFIALSTGASLWSFSSANPPKPSIIHPYKLVISKEWADFSFNVQVKNVGGSRMTFSLASEDAILDSTMKRCDPARSVGFSVQPLKFSPDGKITFQVDGDGGYDSAITYISAIDGQPDRRDVNLDGRVDVVDFVAVLGMIGKEPSGKIWNFARRCDFDDSGKIDAVDLAKVMTGF